MRSLRLILAALLGGSSFALAQSTVEFSVDAKQDVKPISPYIYGINQFRGVIDGLPGPWANAGFTRLGGNRFTAYNWTNNASSAGSDYKFQSDDYLVHGPFYEGMEPRTAGAVIPVLELTAKGDAAAMVTVPINGYVAADKKGDGDFRQREPDYLHTRFKPEQPKKNGPFTLTPNADDPIVYQDEFVNWVKTKYASRFADAAHPIFFSLDNEPDWWSHTHSHIHPNPVTYAELVEKSVAYADAIKSVIPSALVFGPVNYGWQGYVRLQDAPDANDRDFQEFYLQQMAEAEKTHHQRLVDVFDVHYYPEAMGGTTRIVMSGDTEFKPDVVQARVQAPRSLWDPTYTETSWIAQKSTRGPIQLIPRLKQKIEKNYPGTKFAMTEYDFGGGEDISGGIAEADALGIFGREGLFVAALWPDRKIAFTAAGFEMFRNFDGHNGSFGDTSVHAETNNIAGTSIYASTDSHDAGRLILVALNKTDHPIDAYCRLANAPLVEKADVYQLTPAAPHPQQAGSITASNSELKMTLPAYSVSTLVLHGKY